jgi:restriction system protein
MAILIFFAFITIFAYILVKSTWFKGKFGEFFVNLMFKIRLPKEQYEIIHNVTLRTEDGTTQIDHIILSVFGIFVVETKNMKGWIFGSKEQPFWTQQIFKFKTQFQNPLHQNYKHTQTLGKLLSVLGIGNEKIFSLVVFVGDSKFKTKMPENVTYGSGAVSYIRSKKKIIMSHEQISQAKGIIMGNMLERGFKTDREHTKHVKTIIGNKN